MKIYECKIKPKLKKKVISISIKIDRYKINFNFVKFNSFHNDFLDRRIFFELLSDGKFKISISIAKIGKTCLEIGWLLCGTIAETRRYTRWPNIRFRRTLITNSNNVRIRLLCTNVNNIFQLNNVTSMAINRDSTQTSRRPDEYAEYRVGGFDEMVILNYRLFDDLNLKNIHRI